MKNKITNRGIRILIAVLILITMLHGVSAQWTNTQATPASQIIYGTSNNYMFSTQWNGTLLEEVKITHNFEGEQKTQTVQPQNNIYSITRQNLPAGIYTWQFEGTDSTGNIYKTEQKKYVIQKSTPSLALYLNGAEKDIQIRKGEDVKITALKLAVTEGEIELINNYENEIKNVSNIETTLKNIEPGTHTIELRHNETENYTLRRISRTITVKDTDKKTETISEISSNLTLQSINVTNLTHDEVIIKWETNNPASTQLYYKNTTQTQFYEYTDSTLKNNHSVQILGLEPNTTYIYKVSSTDSQGTLNSSEYNFTTEEYKENPQYYDVQITPDSNVIYGTTQNYQVSSKWTDDKGIDKVILIINRSENIQEYEMNKNNNTYTYNIQELSAGTFEWYITANDTNGKKNTTPKNTYTVQKAENQLSLLINGDSQKTKAYSTEQLNITGTMSTNQGMLRLKINDELQVLDSEIELITNLSEGNHTIDLIYNESENYTSNSKTLNMQVTNPLISIATNKQTYNLGEEAQYQITFPSGSQIDAEICGPTPETGTGFVECFPQASISGVSSPHTLTHRYTNKTGNYIINIEATHNSQTLTATKNYTVTNSININIQGETEPLTGETTLLEATATGGIAPYTYKWTKPDANIVNDDEIELKYDTKGNRKINMTVTDAKGNQKNKTVNLKVLEWFLTKIKVQDEETKEVITSANVDMDDIVSITNSDGIAELKTPPDTYNLVIDAHNYEILKQRITIDKAQTLTFNLNKKESTTNKKLDVELIKPENKATINTQNTEISARIITDKQAECTIYLTESPNAWSKEIHKETIPSTKTITKTETLLEGKKYEWLVECKQDGTTYKSATRSFTTSKQISITGTEKSLDAGELRTQLEEAIENIETLDIGAKQLSESLGLKKSLEKGLRDHDRTIRDFNNIQFRTDLSETEKEKKLKEYQKNLESLDELPLNIEINEKEEFIAYPREEELLSIATKYEKAESLTGTLQKEELENLQNNILVKTKVAQATITTLTEQEKPITVITRTITYTGNNTEKAFLIESIPKEFAKTASEIISIQDFEIIEKDPLLKYGLEEEITYYVQGHKDLEHAKQSKIIIFTDSLYTKKANSITGNVIGSIDLASPIALIILLLIIIGVYLAYSFDLLEKIIDKFSSGTTKKVREIINKAQQAIDEGNLDEANFLFKEIRLRYEKSPYKAKQIIYEEGTELKEKLDEAYFNQIIEEINNHEISQEQAQKILAAYQVLTERMKEKYNYLVQNIK